MADLEKVKREGRPYSEAKFFNTIPVVAGWTSANNAASRDEEISFKIVSDNARNSDNSVIVGSFEDELLRQLIRDYKASESEKAHKIDETKNELHFMRAIQLTQDCMLCHGDLDTSPTSDGKDMIGFAMENWQIGDMHGAYHVVMSLDKVDAEVASARWWGICVTIPIVIFVVIIFTVIMRKMVKKPIDDLIDTMQAVFTGD
ncbi:hypothetical protein KS4_03770 [Poriferisphaera corsica]|uniref:Tll0287-like domain-containing protein n=1 Tax=Poriferisphaera corsica TaxID=2528020 RepID=A0A517YQ42_9BACT|nr:DUF3365 domain-containing protein [Poriferisphaera corsica]QDU32345.1 hypothetical protein KS4_03770 [Poriferisphaera corsica]